MNEYYWTAEEAATAAQLYSTAQFDGCSQKEAFHAIADKIGKTRSAVSQRYYQRGRSFAGPQRYPGSSATAQARSIHDASPSRPPDSVLAEREYRKSLSRSFTAELMGDPPPGYSALDRRRP